MSTSAPGPGSSGSARARENAKGALGCLLMLLFLLVATVLFSFWIDDLFDVDNEWLALGLGAVAVAAFIAWFGRRT